MVQHISLELSPDDALKRQSQGWPLFDVRGENERALGCAAGAAALPFDTVVASLEASGQAVGQPLLVCCLTGRRSLEAVQRLREAGFTGAHSVAGGFTAWKSAGLPVAYGEGIDADASERYARHFSLAEIGIEGQRRLAEASVLVVGAGGLGSPAAFYLAAAGVGRLGLVDDDTVERSNLQRQVLHIDAAVGMAKVASARERLLALNPTIAVETFPVRVAANNVESLLSGWDLVLDGSDNYPTRYLLNAACHQAGIPLVYGGVTGFEGQVAVFHPSGAPGRQACYECLFPVARSTAEVANCTEAGVLGVLPGLVGVLQGAEALKVLLGIGRPLVDRLLLCDALGMQFRSLATRARPDCSVCAEGAPATPLDDIALACSGE